MDLNALARKYNALYSGDSIFQRRARTLQSIWREEQGYNVGEYQRGGKSYQIGNYLPMPRGEDKLSNYLTENIRKVVRAEVLDSEKSKDKVFGKPRIFNNLLSSQPLCFNLFGELRYNLELASKLIRELTKGRFLNITDIEFEYSPSRRDKRYTGDRSAFDVLLKCTARAGGKGFIGIEVKYHENLRGKPGKHHDRYDEIAGQMACFKNDAVTTKLRKSPLQQIWRDHLLMGAMKQVDGFSDALFGILYPKDNNCCRDAVSAYTNCLKDSSSFLDWTLEYVIDLLKKLTDERWVELFEDRYLAFGKIDA